MRSMFVMLMFLSVALPASASEFTLGDGAPTVDLAMPDINLDGSARVAEDTEELMKLEDVLPFGSSNLPGDIDRNCLKNEAVAV